MISTDNIKMQFYSLYAIKMEMMPRSQHSLIGVGVDEQVDCCMKLLYLFRNIGEE